MKQLPLFYDGIDAALNKEARDRQTYNEQRAEARACGYEFPDFEEWLDPSLTRRRAAERVMTRRRMEAEGYDLD